MEFYIDVEDSSGNKLGAGPITTAFNWQHTRKMDRAGEFSFSMPAGDEMTQYLQARRVVRCWGIVGGQRTELGAGIIDEITVDVDTTSNPPVLVVSGGDLLRELSTRSVGFLELDNYTFDNAILKIMSYAPSGWTPFYDSTSGLGNIYVKFAGESVLAALIAVCKLAGAHFYLPSGRTPIFTAVNNDSGVRAVQSTTATDADELCVVTALEKTSESHNLLTRIYPFGGGNGENRLTLEHTTASAPTGYTLDAANNYLKRDASEATYGQIEKYLSFKNISPISNSLTDLQNAADALFALAYNHLRLNSEPYSRYRLSVAGLEQIIHPTETVRVIWQEFVDGYHAVDIDDDLIVLGVSTQIDNAGVRVAELDVATIDRFPADDFDAIVAQMEDGHVLEAHPQLTATKDRVGPYILRMDNSHNAQFRFEIGAETTALNYAKLRFKLSPLRSSVKASAAESSHTHTVSIGASGSHTHDISHQHDINVQDNSSAASYPVVHLHTVNKTLIYNSGGGGGTKPVPTDVISTSTSASATHTHPATATSSGSAHSHAMQYGIYQDTQYPSGITIWIDGVDRTAALTGSSSIGGGSGIEETYDITQYLDDQSTLRNTHSIEFRCTGGQGEIEAELVMLMTVQAIAVT